MYWSPLRVAMLQRLIWLEQFHMWDDTLLRVLAINCWSNTYFKQLVMKRCWIFWLSSATRLKQRNYEYGLLCGTFWACGALNRPWIGSWDIQETDLTIDKSIVINRDVGSLLQILIGRIRVWLIAGRSSFEIN